MQIRALEPSDAPACDAIIASLPYHFGDPVGQEKCAAAVRRDPGLVAIEDGDIVGFLTVERHFGTCAEITWMAVHAARRRHGIGTALMDRLCEDLRAEGRKVLCVLTLSPSEILEDEPADGYIASRAFYARAGFSLARDFPELWPNDIAVLMVRSI